MPKNSKFTWIWDYLDPRYPFQFFVGARGDGKTYGALDGGVERYENTGEKFMFSRLTPKEQKEILCKKTSQKGNPFKKINKNEGRSIGIVSTGDLVSSICDYEVDDKGKIIIGSSKEYGYSCSLVDLCDIRGQDYSDVTAWIVDEFIPEKHKRIPSGLGAALLNGYDTINRDREDNGEPPLFLFGLANAFDIYNPIFKELGLVSVCEKMINKGQKDYYDKKRRLAIHLLEDSGELAEARDKRALTALTRGTDFYDAAYNNEFAYNDFSNIAYRKVKGYRPIVSLDDIFIWQRVGGRELYATYTAAKVEAFKSKKQAEKLLFKRVYGHKLWISYIKGLITFETYDIKARLLEVIE